MWQYVCVCWLAQACPPVLRFCKRHFSHFVSEVQVWKITQMCDHTFFYVGSLVNIMKLLLSLSLSLSLSLTLSLCLGH